MLGHKMRILWGIYLSLLIHAFFYWGSQYAGFFSPPPERTQSVVIEIQESKASQNEKSKQIVRQAIAPDKIEPEESQDPLTFLSERSQRVRKQMQAQKSGKTENRGSQKPVKNSALNNKSRTPKEIDPFADSFSQSRSGSSASFSQQTGVSTIGEALPQEVSVGSFTALNTDRYLFYSFYARVEDLIRFRWETNVHSALNRTLPEQLTMNNQGIWKTHLEVVLNASGEVKNVVILKESGLRAFDQAAAQAFIQARLLPNPPLEMKDEDGMIRLQYAFQVRFNPTAFVRSRN